MVKSRSVSENAGDTETVVVEGVAPKYKRIGAVTVPTLKVEEGDTIHIYVRGIFEEKTAKMTEKVKDPITGVITLQEKENTLDILPIVNLDTGELMQMVGGTVLVKELKNYQGGDNRYLGRSFEILKKSAKEGSRAKLYEIYEIETPPGVSNL